MLRSYSQWLGLYGGIHANGEPGTSVGTQIKSGLSFVSGVGKKGDPPLNALWTIAREEHSLEQWQIKIPEGENIDVMSPYYKI